MLSRFRAGAEPLGRHLDRRGRVPPCNGDRSAGFGAAPRFARAGTELGDGYWVMTPLAQDDGTVVLVNRGFVPADKRDPASWGAPTPRPRS